MTDGRSNPTPLTTQQREWCELHSLAAFYLLGTGDCRRLAGRVDRDEALSAAGLAAVHCARAYREAAGRPSTLMTVALRRQLREELRKKIRRVRRWKSLSAAQADAQVGREHPPGHDDEQGEQADALLKHVRGRDRAVLRLRLGLNGSTPMTYQEIGLLLNKSPQFVQQIYVRAIEKIRRAAGVAD